MYEEIGIVGREATALRMGTRCDTGRETISDGDTPVQRLAECDNSVSDWVDSCNGREDEFGAP